jgi:anti-sigma regulatory factor (Ser/Thr protein kinase)
MRAKVFREGSESATYEQPYAAGNEHARQQGQDRPRHDQTYEYPATNAAEKSRRHESRAKEKNEGTQENTFWENKIVLAAAAAQSACEYLNVKVRLPNSADLRNITAFINSLDCGNTAKFELEMHDKWVGVHPSVLALTACAAELVHSKGGEFVGKIPNIRSLPYLIRMKLFDYVRLEPPTEIKEHEESGRFIPLTQIKNTGELHAAITNLVPLLHASPKVADPIKYVFSEMVRNALEHSASPVGAFVAAQYYPETKRIAIGIADAGIGIYDHIRQFHLAKDSKDAITLALRPGITGTTSRIGGTAFNAGAGLFFTKSIASFSRNMFTLYSGNAAYRLMKGPADRPIKLHPNPLDDHHKFPDTLPAWPGTLVGIDINVREDLEFADLLNQIRKSYYLNIKRKKDFAPRIKFS